MTKGLRKGLTSYGDPDFSLFLRKVFIKAMGYSDDALERPIVGITNTYSDYNPCHGNVPQLVEAVKRGVMLSGAMPFAFPTISIHESFSHPTSMYLRNLMAMDTEEMIRAQPMDAIVVIGGCDKTLPAQIMAAASVDLPTVVVPVGPMVVGHHKGEVLGACTDCRRLWASFRAGKIDESEIDEVEERLAPSVGTCMVMGTASTMACVTEALGLSLPMSGTIPAPHAERIRLAEASGRRAAAMAVAGGPCPSELLTPAAFRNAQVVMQAIGGSTNGLIHLTAIANRTTHRLDLDAFDQLGRDVPVLVDLKPSGAHYMEHFHHAGGVPRLMAELGDLIDLDARTVAGGTLHDVVGNASSRAGRGRDPQQEKSDQGRRRDGRAARQPGTRRRRDQAVGRNAGAAAAHRPGRGVRVRRGYDAAHRRPEPRRKSRRRAGVAQCRAEGCAGHAGGRLPANPAEAGARGREGHGADFRRAHERHRVRHHRAAHRAGICCRWAARAGALRRPDPARRTEPAHQRAGRRCRVDAAETAAAAKEIAGVGQAWLRAPVVRHYSASRSGLRLRLHDRQREQ